MKFIKGIFLKRWKILWQSSLKICSRTMSDKIVVLCPGQSSQYVGMLQNISSSPKVRSMVDVVSKILGYDLMSLCLHGPEDVLNRTVNCQPAVVVATLIGYEILKERINMENSAELKVDAIAGYSVGEISALHISGMMGYEEALMLLMERAVAMDYASTLIPSGMVALQGLSLDLTRQMCEDLNLAKNNSMHQVSVAIEQYPNCVSLGGSWTMLNKIMNREHPLIQDSNQVKLSTLKVSGAFHTNYMLPAQERLHNYLQNTSIQRTETEVDLYSNVTGSLYRADDDICEILVRQIAEPVLWNSIMGHIRNESQKTSLKLYEVGPGKQLKAVIGKIDRQLVRRVQNVLV